MKGRVLGDYRGEQSHFQVYESESLWDVLNGVRVEDDERKETNRDVIGGITEDGHHETWKIRETDFVRSGSRCTLE